MFLRRVPCLHDFTVLCEEVDEVRRVVGDGGGGVDEAEGGEGDLEGGGLAISLFTQTKKEKTNKLITTLIE